METNSDQEQDAIPNPLTLLYATAIGTIFHEGSITVHDFAFELVFDALRTGWLREPLYSWSLDGLHYARAASAGFMYGFFVRLLTERPWRASAAWALLCALGGVTLSFILETSFSRALWDLRHAPLEIAALALGCAVGVRVCLRYQDAGPVRGFQEILRRFVIWERR